MIQLSSLLAAIPHGPVRQAAPGSGATGGFALPGPAQAAGDAAEILGPGRQILAAPGKALPALDLDAECEEAALDSEDITFAWFALPVAPQPAPATPPRMAPRPAVIGAEGATVESEAFAMETLPIVGGADTETGKPEFDAAQPAELQPEIADEAAPIRLRIAAAPAQPAVESSSATSAPQLAAPLSAPAPSVATPAENRRTLVQDLLPAGGATALADIVRPHAIAAPADVQQGTLDMRRQEWIGQMAERLEAMRDAGPTRETRLSLSPEALGKVDVSIRQDGDRIHVHFAAETQAARQLLTDAQPRLAELAEARGVKLGQTSVDSGAGQGAGRERQQELVPQSFAPRAPDVPETTTTATDDRIA